MPESGARNGDGGGVVAGDDTEMMAVPAWLDKSFVRHAFAGFWADETVCVESLLIEAATGKGENYASAMYRVKAVCSRLKDSHRTPHPVCCIIKVPYSDGFGLQLLNTMNAYDKELIMYETVLPRLRAALRQRSLDVELVADTIHVSHARKAIVFQDLALDGFRMPARSNGLDMRHAKQVLHKLAIFHAGCSFLYEQDATVFERHFKHGMLNRNDREFDNMYLTGLDALRSMVAAQPDLQHYAPKLAALRPHLLERGRRAFDAKPGQFNTLIHGDIWVNNTMFTYRPTATKAAAAAAAATAKHCGNHCDDIGAAAAGDATEPPAAQPDRSMLVDFQFCCWTSPTIDLHYFFNTSLREELRQQRQDELLQYYHGELCAALGRLGYAGYVPTLHAFHVDFVQTSFYGFIASCLVQPIMLNEQTDDADIEALHGCDERAARFKRVLYSNEKVQRNVRHLLPVFDRRGLLD